MSSYTYYTMLAFGITAFISGVHTLVQPVSVCTSLLLFAGAEPSMRGNALASIAAMGIYYTISAVQENRAFSVASVPMRLLTASVFTIQGGPWVVPGVWEGVGALATGIALLADREGKLKK